MQKLFLQALFCYVILKYLLFSYMSFAILSCKQMLIKKRLGFTDKYIYHVINLISAGIISKKKRVTRVSSHLF